jgi:RND family efflux transporter MFP subunit
LDYDRIVAPASGRLGGIAVFEGSLVQAGGAPLLTITQVDPVAVQFSIPDSSLVSLQQALSAKGMSAGVSITVPGTTQSVRGKLYFADSTVDVATGTIKSKAEFANPGSLLWPGQFVPTRLHLQTLQAVTTLPINALVTSSNGKFVYVVDAENTAQQKPVKVLHTYGARMAVEGVSDSDQVIVDGKQNLRPGSKVRLIGVNAGLPAPKTEASTQP